MEVTFENPLFLWFFISVPLLIVLHFFSLRFTMRNAITFANFEAIRRAIPAVYGGGRVTRNITLLILRLVALVLLICAAAGMTVWYTGDASTHDFVVAIDASGSMLAQDFEPNRIEAAKEATVSLLDGIEGHAQVGVVSFSGVAFIKQKMTDSIQEAIASTRGVDIEYASGTAIGEAIVTGVNMFEDTGRSRALVLFTDGQNTVGMPLDRAISYAKDNQVTVHTVGVATSEGAELNRVVTRLDNESLQRVSRETGGKYFKASEAEDLTEALQGIASTSEQTVPFDMRGTGIALAICLLFIEYVLINTRFRTIP